MRTFMISALLAVSMMGQAQDEVIGMVIDKTMMSPGMSQTKTKDKKGKSDTLTFAKVAYRITYQSKAVRDTLKTPYRYYDDEMRLDISADGVSKFYSQTKVLREQMMLEQLKKNYIDMTVIPKSGLLSWTFYKNYPAAGKTLMLDAVIGGADCAVEEKMETPEWSMLPDSTAEIMGYPCQLAVTNFKGRQWYAWYTEDIPLDEGPWKLRGLPGLVLKAYDSSRQFIFDGQGMEQPDDAPITFVKADREKVDQKTLRRLKESYDPNDILKRASANGAKITIKNADGSKIEKLSKPKFNLIEQ